MESVCMYPKWIVIDIVDPESIGRMPAETFFVSPPEGVLNVQIHCCKDLMIGDILTSDPYVKLSVLDEVYQTPTIFKTLNPTWRNAEYSFLIRDKRADCLKLDVFDYDVVSSDEFLGTTQIYLDSLLDGVAQSFTHELRGVAHGTITFSVAYIRLSKPEELDSDQIISSAQDIDFNIDDLMDTFAMATGKDDYLSRSLKTSSDNVEIDVSNIQQFSVTPSVVDGPISPNVDVVSTEGSFSAADNNEKESQSPRSSTNVMGNVLKWARKSGPSSISKLFKKNNLKNDSNKSADSNKTNSLDSKKDPLSAKTTVPMNHIESIPRMSSLTKVSGVITLSDLHVFELNSSATASMGNYVHFVVYFNLGHYKRKTSEANKQVDVKFKETFNIIVGDIYQDVLTIKIKKINHLGYKQVISQIDVRAKNIMNSPDQTYTVSEDISKDKVIASGQLECKLKYRAAARMPPAIL